MRSLFMSVVLTGSTSLAWGQELVQNGSFEQASGCPTSTSQIALAMPWVSPTLGTSDYYNPCYALPDLVGVPANGVGFQEAAEGSSYAGIITLLGAGGLPEWREYIHSPLLGPGLEAQKTYRFSMQLSLAEKSSVGSDRLGAYFSSAPVGSTGFEALPFTPQVESPAGAFFTDITNWMTFSDTFVASGGEQFVTVGNFHDATGSSTIPAGSGPLPPLQFGTAYYYVDDVSLQCEPCTDAPLDLTAWWPLDETGGGIAYDVVGAQHGVHEDSPVPVAGYVDGALDFLGNGVSVPTSVGIEFDVSDFSIDAWVKAVSIAPDQTLFSKIAFLPAPTDPGYTLALDPGGAVTFTMVDAALNVVSATSSAALVAGEWTLVTVTVDRSETNGGRIYVGSDYTVFDPTGAPGSLTNPLPLLFARDGGAAVGEDLIGALDEVEIFHVALTEPEVLALVQARTSGKCKTYLVLVPVVGVPVGTGGTLGTTPTITNSTGTTGTFTFAVTGAAPGTKCGVFTSTVAGPANPVIRTPQPVRVGAGQTTEIQIDLDIPKDLGRGEIACYTVSTTHVETGRTFLSRAVLRGTPRTQLGPGLPSSILDARR